MLVVNYQAAVRLAQRTLAFRCNGIDRSTFRRRASAAFGFAALRAENTGREASMAHHYSGPNFGFPYGDARLDMTDLYAFPTPHNDSTSIFVLNVHPSFDFNLSQPTRPDPFSPDALYEFKIDTNGDAIADMTYRIRFSPFLSGQQTATLRFAEGSQAARAADEGQILIEAAPVSVDKKAQITEGRDYHFFAGWRSDAFFFDPVGAVNNFKFGKDFFLDKDVCSIVLEVPNAALGFGEVGLWARTLVNAGGKWVQAERGARPAQPIFLTGESKAAYLSAEPADDAQFISVFAHSLEHAGGYTPDKALSIAKMFLPDIMKYDHSRPASYPNNGRALTDDVLDYFLSILTNRRVTTDGIGAHNDLLDVFPYLGPPHRTRS